MSKTFAHLPGYEALARLGRGARAVIYAGRERGTRRRVAIKHVVRRGPEDDRFLEQTENEFQIASKLEHPALRRCLDIVRVRRWLKTQELFLIMEYVDGTRLEDLYRERRPTRFERVLEVFVQVAEGLRAMHRQGYVHADIKPNNILITPAWRAKIIDFGQSCPLGHTKARIQGTPDYIAPEQVRLNPLDQRTDVYNFGATMYWVVTGKAFSTILPNAPAGTRKMDVDSRRRNDAPHLIHAAVPLPLSVLIMECCQNERDKRPWDMSKVLSRLDTVRHMLHRTAGRAGATAWR